MARKLGVKIAAWVLGVGSLYGIWEAGNYNQEKRSNIEKETQQPVTQNITQTQPPGQQTPAVIPDPDTLQPARPATEAVKLPEATQPVPQQAPLDARQPAAEPPQTQIPQATETEKPKQPSQSEKEIKEKKEPEYKYFLEREEEDEDEDDKYEKYEKHEKQNRRSDTRTTAS